MFVRPSFRLSVQPLTAEVQQRAKKSHYQSEVFVCVLNSRADAVDRLLIFRYKKSSRLFAVFLYHVNF